MALREIESALPPGFRFYPSDEELVCHYLHKKVSNERIEQGTLVEVDLHAREPWELPDVAKLTAGEWYFFSFRDRKYATGSRTNRATRTGYWKATGKDREVRSTGVAATGGAVVGMRKTLVFYQGRAPNGAKTDWVMHEFRLDTPHSLPREDWVICRVFQKGKGDGDGQDNPGASSPNFADGSTSRLMLDDQATTGGYHNLQLTAGSSTGFAPPQYQVWGGANGGVPTNAHYGGAVLDRCGSFPQETGGTLPEFYRNGGVGDGFNVFLDMDFGDMANHGNVGSPQGWN